MTNKPTIPTENPLQSKPFLDFMRKLISVPKTEIVKEEKKWEKKRAKKKRRA